VHNNVPRCGYNSLAMRPRRLHCTAAACHTAIAFHPTLDLEEKRAGWAFHMWRADSFAVAANDIWLFGTSKRGSVNCRSSGAPARLEHKSPTGVKTRLHEYFPLRHSMPAAGTGKDGGGRKEARFISVSPSWEAGRTGRRGRWRLDPPATSPPKLCTLCFSCRSGAALLAAIALL